MAIQLSSPVECELCPKACRIEHGFSGDCRVRVNINGRLISLVYGRPVAVHLDPIEKKPLFHFLPGTRIFSLATAGCNLHCQNCQNWQISQANPEETDAYDLPPKKVIERAIRNRCPSIAYTYSDPSIYYEYAYDTSLMARDAGIKNVLVTAGYLSPAPGRKLARVVDAANIDLKFFDDRLYKKVTSGSLKPVLNNIEISKEEGVWVELTNLLIPTLNDDLKMIARMCRWIVKHAGPETPLHFSRFHPDYKMRNLPPTPADFMKKAVKVAKENGLRHVYLGNLLSETGENTYCPMDNTLLIERTGYTIMRYNLDEQGRCPVCQTRLSGVFL
ncbi:MAG: AmmeMemoRadiSam system radical SAM enzyme [bacterium]